MNCLKFHCTYEVLVSACQTLFELVIYQIMYIPFQSSFLVMRWMASSLLLTSGL